MVQRCLKNLIKRLIYTMLEMSQKLKLCWQITGIAHLSRIQFLEIRYSPAHFETGRDVNLVRLDSFLSRNHVFEAFVLYPALQKGTKVINQHTFKLFDTGLLNTVQFRTISVLTERGTIWTNSAFARNEIFVLYSSLLKETKSINQNTFRLLDAD